VSTVAHAPGWQRLDRRMLVVHPAVDLLKLVPVLLVIAITGGSTDDRWRLGGGIALAVAVLALGVSRWFTTSYRIGDERVEVRTGLVRRHHRSVHRDRIRTADLTANPAHRLFGLAVVRVGTGRREGGDDAELTLDAVRRG
jgi:putative membrane protein